MSTGDPSPSRDEQLAALLAAPVPRVVPPGLSRAAVRQVAPLRTIIFGCCLAVFGLFMGSFLFSGGFYRDWQLSAGNSSTATGRVTAVTKTSLSINHSRVMRCDFAFTTAGGSPEKGICFTTGQVWHVNDAVTVRYLPDHPDVCCIEGARLNQGGSAGLFILIFPGIGLGLVAWAFVSRRRVRDLLERGAVGEANVLTIEQTRMRVNNRYVYKINLQRTDAPDAGGLTLRSSEPAVVDFAGQRMMANQPVFVLYDPARPRRILLPETL